MSHPDITVADDGTISIAQPEHRDTPFHIHPEGVVDEPVLSIDFYYNRPVVYFHAPQREDVQLMVALPTPAEPTVDVTKLANATIGNMDLLDPHTTSSE